MNKDGQITWLDSNNLRPGNLIKFYVYVGYVNTTSPTADISLQIWKPWPKTSGYGSSNISYQLVWFVKVTVSLTYTGGALYIVGEFRTKYVIYSKILWKTSIYNNLFSIVYCHSLYKTINKIKS